MAVSEALAQYAAQHPDVARYCIAYSGGRDSHVLLHAAAALFADIDTIAVRALHIDHGLSPDSARWAEHCAQVAAGLGVPLECARVQVQELGNGPEGNARAARYALFAERLGPSEHLLLAQHADDQAETFLLQALRGSGPDGLASMPRKRTFGRGIMARPLIVTPAAQLADYATSHALDWIEDPSNADVRFDRNYLRHEILPRLRERWPSAVQTLGRSARRSAAASQTLLGVASEDLETVRLRGASELSVSELRALPRERAYNVLRLWVRSANLRLPRLQDLARVLDEQVLARPDSAGIVNVRDYEFRRHADRLYLLPPTAAASAFCHEWPSRDTPLLIPEIGLELTREGCLAQGLALPEGAQVTVRSRAGGELIKLGEPAFHKAVKKLLQEAAVPPWQRERVPLVFVADRLAAVWQVAVATDFRVPDAAARDTDDAAQRIVETEAL